MNFAVELKNRVKKNHNLFLKRHLEIENAKENALVASEAIKKEKVSDHDGLDASTDEECCGKMPKSSEVTSRSEVTVPRAKAGFECNFCGFKTSWKVVLKFHMTTHYKIVKTGTQVKCAICLKWSDDIRSFKLHQCSLIQKPGRNQIKTLSESRNLRSKSCHVTLRELTCPKCPAECSFDKQSAHKKPNCKKCSSEKVFLRNQRTVQKSEII